MKKGDLFEVRHKWLLPHSAKDFWSSCGPVMYLGEDITNRDDGIKIINHVVLVDGVFRTLDSTFLRFLEPHSV